MLETMAVGCVRDTVCVFAQPWASVMVQVKFPAARPEAVADDPPEGAQAYVYGAVPPVADTVAAPLLLPLQVTLVLEARVGVTAVGCVMLRVLVLVQLLASLIVQV